MTDVYISCAKADAERITPVVEAVKAEGWSVWFEPNATVARREHAIDAELGAAGAVIVLWSDNSRDSEFVRTEAATGLYRNKLIQVTMGGDVPPRPFDQLEAIDLGSWNGASGDPTWQRILGCIRLFAGSPGADRPQVVRNSAAGFASQAAVRPAARPGVRPMPTAAPASSAAAAHDALHEAPVIPKPAPTPVFDATVESTPSDAARSDQALGVAQGEPPSATVTPAATPSPIDAAVSEMERKISGSVREPVAEAKWPVDPEPVAWAPAPEPAPAEPLQFARSGGNDVPPSDGDDHDWSGRNRAGRGRGPDAGWAEQNAGGAAGMVSPRRDRPSNGIAPVAIVGALAVLGGGLWFVDPAGWREGGEKAAFAASPAAGAVELAPAVARGPSLLAARGPLVEDEGARALWAGVDRADPEALRDFILAYPDTMSGERARALLKVQDAQAWADAVTEDVESGYQLYLAAFPAPTGEMAGAAASRLTSLGEERQQAITTIQIQLRELGAYTGGTTGLADSVSQQGADRFASQEGGVAPVLAEAAPRDLRAFGDRVLAAVRARAEDGAASAQIAALAVTAAPEPTPVAAPVPAAATPVAEATTAATIADATADDDASADALANEALQLAAWEGASQTGTIAAYGAFLRDYPASPNAIAARAAIEQLSRPPAYGLDWLSAETRSAVEAARTAQAQAQARAAAARARADQADAVATSARSGLADARTVVAPDGDIYETQTANNQPNGLGVRTAGDAQSNGDRYRGELRDGLGQGLGVYEYGDNPNNQAARALRYEGEHAGDVARGYGVTQWQNGNRFEGQDSGEAERGVMAFANGQRYEGQMLNGNRNGYGVFWTGDGEVMLAGRWENGDLVEPMARRAGPDFAALTPPVATAQTDTP